MDQIPEDSSVIEEEDENEKEENENDEKEKADLDDLTEQLAAIPVPTIAIE